MLKAFPQRKGVLKEYRLLLLLQDITENPSQSNQVRKQNKRHQYWKEVKFPLFKAALISCIENLKDFTRKLLDLINKFCKVAQYRKIPKLLQKTVRSNQ